MESVLLMRRRRIKVDQGTGRLAGWPRGLPGGPAHAMTSSELTLIRLPLSGRSR
jgi:hypothetical protein